MPWVVAAQADHPAVRRQPSSDRNCQAQQQSQQYFLVALAAQAAGDDSGESIASQMQDMSSGGEPCTAYRDCLELLEGGKDIDYEGVSGPVEFNEKGDPSEASIGIYEFGADNRYTFVEAKTGKI